eukprot:COSAG01_NODE_4412_length_5051_cov_2.786349_5_plen_315_part_00
MSAARPPLRDGSQAQQKAEAESALSRADEVKASIAFADPVVVSEPAAIRSALRGRLAPPAALCPLQRMQAPPLPRLRPTCLATLCTPRPTPFLFLLERHHEASDRLALGSPRPSPWTLAPPPPKTKQAETVRNICSRADLGHPSEAIVRELMLQFSSTPEVVKFLRQEAAGASGSPPPPRHSRAAAAAGGGAAAASSPQAHTQVQQIAADLGLLSPARMMDAVSSRGSLDGLARIMPGGQVGSSSDEDEDEDDGGGRCVDMRLVQVWRAGGERPARRPGGGRGSCAACATPASTSRSRQRPPRARRPSRQAVAS